MNEEDLLSLGYVMDADIEKIRISMRTAIKNGGKRFSFSMEIEGGDGDKVKSLVHLLHRIWQEEGGPVMDLELLEVMDG